MKSALLALLLVALAWSHVDAAKKDAVKKMAGLGVRKSAGTEDTGDEGADADTDFFDSIDPTTVGRKDCVNQDEVDHCVEDCEQDRDCAAVAQESMCEQDCLVMCKYLDHWNSRKCVNHMLAHVSWYRDVGLETKGGKYKVKPRQEGGRFAISGPNGEGGNGESKSNKKKSGGGGGKKKGGGKGGRTAKAAPSLFNMAQAPVAPTDDDDGKADDGGDDA